jgi:hypothetical protein
MPERVISQHRQEKSMKEAQEAQAFNEALDEKLKNAKTPQEVATLIEDVLPAVKMYKPRIMVPSVIRIFKPRSHVKNFVESLNEDMTLKQLRIKKEVEEYLHKKGQTLLTHALTLVIDHGSVNVRSTGPHKQIDAEAYFKLLGKPSDPEKSPMENYSETDFYDFGNAYGTVEDLFMPQYKIPFDFSLSKLKKSVSELEADLVKCSWQVDKLISDWLREKVGAGAKRVESDYHTGMDNPHPGLRGIPTCAADSNQVTKFFCAFTLQFLWYTKMLIRLEETAIEVGWISNDVDEFDEFDNLDT